MAHKKVFLILTSFMLTACTTASSNISLPEVSYQFIDLSTHVYEYKPLPHDFTYTFSGNDIAIDGYTVTGLKGNTTSSVTATDDYGRVQTFDVYVNNRPYTSNHSLAEAKENWFAPVTVEQIPNLSDDFPLGIDISMTKRIYDRGGRYYNSEGVEQSLFQILKAHGVNYTRFRLFNDPYDYAVPGEDYTFAYGAGYTDLVNVTWMAREAKAAGLKVYLDFHYSDFWADPGNQIVPKAWSNLTSVEMISEALYTFTKETLLHMKENAALPDIISIGNEITSGMLLHKPGGITSTPSAQAPLYLRDKTSFDSSLSGRLGVNNSANLLSYLEAGIRAVREVTPSSEILLHLARSFRAPDNIINFYNTFNNLDYDIIGLSGYSYWHFTRMSDITANLNLVAASFPNKKISIVETSYGFTYETDTWAANSFSATADSIKPLSGYQVSPAGQAKFVRDLLHEFNSVPNSYGLFYWEGAWIPRSMAGWADDASRSSWANQAFFSYDGKVLPSLDVFNLVKGGTIID